MVLACAAAAVHADGVVMQLELPDVESTVFLRLTDYADKPMLLNFWSSDCPPCIAEMPMLFQLAPKQPGAQFLGIAVDDRFKARRFLAVQAVSYPQAVAPVETDGLMRRFGNPSGALPYTVVLSRKHQVCRARRGAVDAGWVASALRACS